MAKPQDPPIYDPVIETGQQEIKDDAFGKAKLSWILWFQGILSGDSGTSFAPGVANLTIVGSPPTITGGFFQNQGFTDFYITVTPNGGNTTATAGSTYFTLPFDVVVDAPCFAVSGLLGSNAGMVDAATNRCYPPAWSAVTAPLTVTGRVVSG